MFEEFNDFYATFNKIVAEEKKRGFIFSSQEYWDNIAKHLKTWKI